MSKNSLVWQRTYAYRLFAVFIDSSRVELRIKPIASVAKTLQVKPRWVQKYQIYWRLRTIVALEGAGHTVPRVSMFKHSPHNRLSTMEHQEPLVRNESAPSLHLSHSFYLSEYTYIHVIYSSYRQLHLNFRAGANYSVTIEQHTNLNRVLQYIFYKCTSHKYCAQLMCEYKFNKLR